MSKKKDLSTTDDVHDFFEQNPELNLQDLDTTLLIKLIVHALDQCVQDNRGEGPTFMIAQDFIHMEIADKRFSIAIRDNSLYS
jgi:hypothetical protein